jgi:tRNA(Arg) A34 adenosine deaminase TadA
MAHTGGPSLPKQHDGGPAELSRRSLIRGSMGLLACGAAGCLVTDARASHETQASVPADQSADERFMRRAIELSRLGLKKGGDGRPFAAVIVKDGAIVGEGWSRVVTDHDPTAHGEVIAIRDAGQRLKTNILKGCRIYTTGQPCPMCLCAIYWSRIEQIYYGFSVEDSATIGFDDRVFFEQIIKPLKERQVPETQLMRDQAFAVAKDYLADPRRL